MLKFLLPIAFVIFAQMSMAQVAVYRIEFKDLGDSINFQEFEQGYYVVPAQGGSGNLVLTSYEGALRTYFPVDNFGTAFFATERDRTRMVISMANASDAVNTSIVAHGKLATTLRSTTVSTTTKARVARVLRGFSLSADSEQDVPFEGDEVDTGVVGFSEVKFILEQDQTNRANQAGETADETFTRLVEELESRGFVNPDNDTDTTTGEDIDEGIDQGIDIDTGEDLNGDGVIDGEITTDDTDEDTEATTP